MKTNESSVKMIKKDLVLNYHDYCVIQYLAFSHWQSNHHLLYFQINCIPNFSGDPAKSPAKVAFSVCRTSPLGPVMEDTTIIFDNIFTNIAESFDTYSSHFICKVNGTYLFSVHLLSNNINDAYAWLMVNGKHKVPIHGDHRSGYGTGSNTIILSLFAEDHVWIQLIKNSSLLNDFSTFSGYLLFEH